MKETGKTLIYAAVLGLICSSLLTGASMFAQPYVEVNRRAERNRNILTVLGVSYDSHTSAKDLEEIFGNEVAQDEVNRVTVYRYPKSGKAERMAVPVAGPGLWGPIK